MESAFHSLAGAGCRQTCFLMTEPCWSYDVGRYEWHWIWMPLLECVVIPSLSSSPPRGLANGGHMAWQDCMVCNVRTSARSSQLAAAACQGKLVCYPLHTGSDHRPTGSVSRRNLAPDGGIGAKLSNDALYTVWTSFFFFCSVALSFWLSCGMYN